MGNAVDGLNKQEPTPSSSRKRAPVIWPGVLIFTTWTIALLAVLTNRSFLLDHRYLLQQSHLPWIVALVIFLASW